MATPGLEQLRDIHPVLSPDQALSAAAGDWWPLSLIGFVLVVVFAWLIYRRRRGSALSQSLKKLRLIEAQFACDGDAPRFAGDLNRLLREEASRRYPEQDIRRLTGDAWLAFLDRTGGDGVFCQGTGRCLASLPYQPGGFASAALGRVVAQWLATK